jgi:hypothetical protein
VSVSRLPEQGENGLQTRSVVAVKALDVVSAYAKTWDEIDRRHGRLLLALLALARENPEAEGFTNQELIGRMQALGFHVAAAPGDPDGQARFVRQYWKKLKALWDQKAEGIAEQLETEGLICRLRIEIPIHQGGAGKLAKRGFTWEEPTSVERHARMPRLADLATPIRYTTEDVKESWWWNRVFSHPVQLRGWAVLLLALLVLVTCTVVLLVSLVAWVPLTRPDSLLAGVAFVIAIAPIAATFWFGLARPFVALPEDRIVMAPLLLQGFGPRSDFLLELRWDEEADVNTFRFVRFTAPCPVCGERATVQISDGGREFHHRLVGRCRRAPKEHVFSFDHITREGCALRHAPVASSACTGASTGGCVA